MQNEAAIIRGETGQMVLAIPGNVAPQNLELEISQSGIVLKDHAKIYLEIEDMEQEILSSLAQLKEIAILEVEDPSNPPDEIKAWARIKSQRTDKAQRI